METASLTREQVLSHRAAVQDLSEPSGHLHDCAVLRLGLQNTPPGSAAAGLLARTADAPHLVTANLSPGAVAVPPAESARTTDPSPATTSGALAVVYAARGAPYLVARSEVPLLAAALHPLDPAEADAVDEVAAVMTELVRETPATRPALSEAVTARVSDEVVGWCERCRARHVDENVFRKATVQAGLELDPEASPVTFRPLGAALEPQPRDEARLELFRRYVRLTGVTTPAELATWLGYQVGAVKPTWELLADELVPVRVLGRRRWALAADLAALRGDHPSGPTALLPPADSYLLGDRALVVPEREQQRELWRPVGSPGSVVVDGEVVGSWRQRVHRDRLELTVHPFATIRPSARERLATAAHRLAELRSLPEVDLRYDDN